MRVDVDESRHHHEAAAVDLAVRRTRVGAADMSERVAREGDVAGGVGVTAALVGDDPVDVADDRGGHGLTHQRTSPWRSNTTAPPRIVRSQRVSQDLLWRRLGQVAREHRDVTEEARHEPALAGLGLLGERADIRCRPAASRRWSSASLAADHGALAGLAREHGVDVRERIGVAHRRVGRGRGLQAGVEPGRASDRTHRAARRRAPNNRDRRSRR